MTLQPLPSWAQFGLNPGALRSLEGNPGRTAPAPRPLKINITKAGETEYITEDGYRVRIGMFINAVFDTGEKDAHGFPIHQATMDFKVVGITRLMDELEVPDAVNGLKEN